MKHMNKKVSQYCSPEFSHDFHRETFTHEVISIWMKRLPDIAPPSFPTSFPRYTPLHGLHSIQHTQHWQCTNTQRFAQIQVFRKKERWTEKETGGHKESSCGKHKNWDWLNYSQVHVGREALEWWRVQSCLTVQQWYPCWMNRRRSSFFHERLW